MAAHGLEELPIIHTRFDTTPSVKSGMNNGEMHLLAVGEKPGGPAGSAVLPSCPVTNWMAASLKNALYRSDKVING